MLAVVLPSPNCPEPFAPQHLKMLEELYQQTEFPAALSFAKKAASVMFTELDPIELVAVMV
jgi:hypothetical protein